MKKEKVKHGFYSMCRKLNRFAEWHGNNRRKMHGLKPNRYVTYKRYLMENKKRFDKSDIIRCRE